MKYQIKGAPLSILELTMDAGETVVTESGGMAWYRGDFKMETNMKGGIMGAIGRKLTGEGLFMTTYSCGAPDGMIAFASSYPGVISPIELAPGQELICQKDSFLCAASTVTLQVHFRKKVLAGLFGGEGFVMQKITGPGLAFVELAGHIEEYVLAPGEKVLVDTGHIAMFEPTVQFDMQMVKGVKNILFGGEGLMLCSLVGPGRVWLQSMPMANLALRIARYLPTKG